QLVSMNTICSGISITDEHGTIRDSTVPEVVGTGVENQDYFRALAERTLGDGKMFIGPSTHGAKGREWHMNLALPLHRPHGSFAGVIVAALRLSAIGSFYEMANVGSSGIIAVVGMDSGKVRLAIGPSPID